MLDWLSARPFQIILICLAISFLFIYAIINIKDTKKIFFLLVFFLPLSLRTSSGTLGMWFAIILYLITLLFYKDPTPNITSKTDKFIALIILIVSTLSLFVTDSTSFFINYEQKLRISPRYLYIIVMVSNYCIYSLCKKYIKTKEDIKKVLLYLLISFSIASISAYLQWLNKGMSIFEYIVLANNNESWATRVAGTMEGYESLAGITMILILFTIFFLLYAKNIGKKISFLIILLNFLIILTLTQTRGIFVALSIASVQLLFIYLITANIKGIFKIIITTCCLTIIFTGAIFTIDIIRPEHKFIDRINDFKNIDIKAGKFSTRTEAWKVGIDRIKSMTSVQDVFGSGYTYLFMGETMKGRYWGWPHCLYLSYIIRDGFLGFSMLLLFLGWHYKESLRGLVSFRRMEDKELLMLAVLFNLTFVTFLIDEFKIEYIRQDRPENIYWLYFGLLAANSNFVKNYLKEKKYGPQR